MTFASGQHGDARACSRRRSITEIKALIFGYGWNGDAANWEGSARLLSQAVITSPNALHRDGSKLDIAKIWGSSVRAYENGSPFTRHLYDNVVILISHDDTTAMSVASQTVIQCHLPEFPAQPLGSGRIYQSYEKHEGKWALVHREVIYDWSGDKSSHLAFPWVVSEPRANPSDRYAALG